MAQQFDIFLSYKSEDHLWVRRLKDALQDRGVQVWLDKDEIRPGDQFVWALQNGLETSRSVALVVTPESVTSGWVADEYSRAVALSNEGRTRLIPILLRDAKLPGFLANRQHVDFRAPSDFGQSVDRLVWPGVTGKDVIWHPVGVTFSEPWDRLLRVALDEGIHLDHGANDPDRLGLFVESTLRNEKKRLVLICDIFEGRPAASGHCRYDSQEYIKTILHIREATKNRANEVLFLLYHQSDAWARVPDVASLPADLVHRLKHYFTLHQDLASDELMRKELRLVWNRIQRDLMSAETSKQRY